ncbi:MAG: hypothetical protein ACOX7X_02465 [Methanosarcina flavescens]|jgi:hypothetical protein|uniref:Uncharacterized protein n=1 Tax=Methanosarcina flavescens TaxID=1715806 RepID=A0A660HPA3_9EURY|nr:hypothetical protein [Methanosarcina flavescens]AYK14084.1 hypothetical protein AOB57_001690 [Methanosarcina flavescens]NLK32681.1 hypothetical protein [Methanosarcina flavescens]
MVRDTGKALRGPAIVLLAVGAVFNIILFILMFRFADEENLLMVLLTAALIGIISLVVAKGLVSISRRDYGK